MNGTKRKKHKAVPKTPEFHGMSKTRIYHIWRGMMDRCENSSLPSWEYYGGRGIRVCERWRESFVVFLKDMGPRPDGMSIDRIDVNGNYEPGNCRWATIATQSRNKRNSMFYDGINLVDLGKIIGIKGDSVAKRIRRGLDVLASARSLMGKGPCPNPGELAPCATMSNREAHEIRRRWEEGDKHRGWIVEVAREKKVSKQTISRIVKGETYK